MFDRIYIENANQEDPRSIQICNKLSGADIVHCENYSEVFNRKAQNFRLQKKSPGLILARKNKNLVMPAPTDFSIGGDMNYYFSYMLNCIYDCRYCFLQGMYRSANYVLFTNYEDFLKEIKTVCHAHPHKSCHFFSGYDCDSLAMEPITGFMKYLLPQISEIPNLLLELRTKSTQIRSLLDMAPLNNCVIAFSLLPDRLAKALDHKAPDLYKRLNAIKKLQQQGWNIGLRFDPLIYEANYEQTYKTFFEEISEYVDTKEIHSVSMGTFRLPIDYFNTLAGYYPDDMLILSPLSRKNKMIGYNDNIKKRLLSFCYKEIHSLFNTDIIYPCEPVAEYHSP